MNRYWYLAIASALSMACGPPARSPECNAMINRCMESCENQPDSITPREQAVATGNTTSTAPSSCEQRCSKRCR